MGEQAWELVKPEMKVIAEKLLIQMAIPAIEKAIDEAVAATENKFDDSLAAMIKPLLFDALKSLPAQI